MSVALSIPSSCYFSNFYLVLYTLFTHLLVTCVSFPARVHLKRFSEVQYILSKILFKSPLSISYIVKAFFCSRKYFSLSREIFLDPGCCSPCRQLIIQPSAKFSEVHMVEKKILSNYFPCSIHGLINYFIFRVC